MLVESLNAIVQDTPPENAPPRKETQWIQKALPFRCAFRVTGLYILGHSAPLLGRGLCRASGRVMGCWRGLYHGCPR